MGMGGGGGGGGRRRRIGGMNDINVTPLIDVMLVLLVIFMVTAPLLTTGVQVDLPKVKSAPTVVRRAGSWPGAATAATLQIGPPKVSSRLSPWIWWVIATATS